MLLRLLLSLCLFGASLGAYDLCDLDLDLSQMTWDVDFTNGYRCDRFTTLIFSFNPPQTKIARDKLQARHIQMYQVGLKSDWTLCHWLIRAEADYAMGGNGKYREISNPVPLVTQTSITRIQANIYKARAQDYSFGLGYLFPFFTYFFPVYQDVHLGPVAGWAYDHQSFKIRHAKSNGANAPYLNGLKYTNLWQSPWLGVDAVFKTCNLVVKVGFEYHWGHWRAKWKLAGPDVPQAFSDRRHSNRSRGHVYYATAKWDIWPHWSLGLGCKYQWFKAFHGREMPLAGSFAAVGLSNTQVDRVQSGIWSSFAGTVNLGYSF